MNEQCVIEKSVSPRTEAYFGGHNVQVKKIIAMPIMIGVAMAYPFSYIHLGEYVHLTNSDYIYSVFSDDTPYINRVNSAMIGKKSVASKIGWKVTAAPIWLAKRMETLQRMPPPTSQEVDTQLKASAEVRKKLTGRLPVSLSGR
jgi:hypothetical protein